MMDLEKFEVTYIEKDGKKVPHIKCRAETIIHPDGRKDVIIHAPTLELVNKELQLAENKETK
jgi:hypothetical protein